MSTETTEGVRRREGRTDPDGDPVGGGVGRSPGGVPEIREDPLREAAEGYPAAETGSEDPGAAGGHSAPDGGTKSRKPAWGTRHEVRKGLSDEQISTYVVARALNQAIISGGRATFKARAAELLGRSVEWIRDRIKNNAQLHALYGNPDTIDGPVTPTNNSAMTRAYTLSTPVEPSEVELIDMVTQADKELLETGLKTLGMSDKLVKRIRDLDGLAKSTGHFIAISLEKTQRSYFVQLMHLMGVAEDLRERLAAPSGDPKYIADDEARAFFYKNYIEMVKEAGSGYERMMNGATAIATMMAQAKGQSKTGKKKMGWGTKNKTAPTSHAKD